MMLGIGEETKWGKVIMIGRTLGERYYWMEDKDGGIAMMPADVVEKRSGAILSLQQCTKAIGANMKGE